MATATRSRFSLGHHRLYFGLRDDDAADAVKVRWPDGSTEVRKDVRADRLVYVTFDRP